MAASASELLRRAIRRAEALPVGRVGGGILHTPVGHLTPESPCPHRGPYPAYSRLVCSQCSATGTDLQRAIDRELVGDLRRLRQAERRKARFRPRGQTGSPG
jgi:hypothetical protein